MGFSTMKVVFFRLGAVMAALILVAAAPQFEPRAFKASASGGGLFR